MSVATGLDVPLNLPSTKGKFPPGPAFLPRLLSGQVFRQHAAESMIANRDEYGDIVHYTAAGKHIYQLNHPSLIEDFFLKDSQKHHRGLVMQRARSVLGQGMLTAEEPLHMRQRRLAAPAFHRARIAGYGAVIGEQAAAMTRHWQPGTVVELHHEMLALALRIVGKCLFDLNVESDEEVRRISAAVDAFMGFLPLAFLPFSKTIAELPIPAMRRIKRGREDLDRLIYGMIADRHAHPGDRGDLLSLLMEADDVEDHTGRMSDTQVRDECITILLAGHETTANALSFALWLMAKHPEVQQRMQVEASAVLGDRVASAADYMQLPYTTAVFAETMRLYPPVWITARTAAVSYELGGYQIPAGALLLAPQFVVHRDPRFFPDPLRFDPERHLGENKTARPKYAYFPFAGGSRQCIGEGLAWMEGVLALATIARGWHLTPQPGAPAEIKVNPAISLRPQNGVPLMVSLR